MTILPVSSEEDECWLNWNDLRLRLLAFARPLHEVSTVPVLCFPRGLQNQFQHFFNENTGSTNFNLF
jgi:hypothetical protein